MLVVNNSQKEYSVDYDDFGCIANCSDAQMAKYNTAIMDCLTAKFGKGWRDSIRKDVPGLDKYGVSAFKNIQYEGNGIATIVLPVIYKALGRSASDPEESVFVGILLTAFRRRQWNFCIEESSTIFRCHAILRAVKHRWKMN